MNRSIVLVNHNGHDIVPEAGRGYLVLQHRLIVISTRKPGPGKPVVENIVEEFTLQPEPDERDLTNADTR